MRQSLAELEDQFAREMEVERDRRDSLIRTSKNAPSGEASNGATAAARCASWLLFVTLVATAVLVTAAMFVTLYLLLAG